MAASMMRIGSSSSMMSARRAGTHLSYVSDDTSKNGPIRIAKTIAMGIKIAAMTAPIATSIASLMSTTIAMIGRNKSLIGRSISLNVIFTAKIASMNTASAQNARKKNANSVMSVTMTPPPVQAYGEPGPKLRVERLLGALSRLRAGSTLPVQAPRPDVHRLRSDEAIRASLLETVSNPAGHATDREGRREERSLEAEAVEQQRGVELDIRLQAPAGFVLLEQADRHALDVLREIVKWISTEEPLGGGSEDVGPRVAHFVHAMAETHQPFSRLDFPAQHLFGSRRIADFEDHVERRAGRAAMQRTLERADRADNRRNEIRAGCGDHGSGGSRCVQAMIDEGVE